MHRKVVFIGFPPNEVQDVLKEFYLNNHTILSRRNIKDALPDFANNGHNSLILTKAANVSQEEENLHSQRIVIRGSTSNLPLTNAGFPELVGRSQKLREVCQRIGMVASTDSTVLIEGESGTGKELVARAIHYHSHRAEKPFIKVNCAALSETLLESEFFGHVRGAFTGAVSERKGRFALANGGTLLLDEIGSMPLSSQAKFLRVLQEKEFEPVGSSNTEKIDVRVIVTDNSDLSEAVEKGIFRKDLYYRLSVFRIVAPPLSQRKEDVPLLSEHFLRRYAHLNRNITGISEEAQRILVGHDWPGNVRQLENVIQHALIVETTNTLQQSSLPERLNTPPAMPNNVAQSLKLQEKLKLFEKQLVQEALTQSNGKKKKAAQLLGVDPKNLSYLLRKHNL